MSKPKNARLTPARRVLLDRLLDGVLDLNASERSRQLSNLAKSHPRIHFHLARLVDASTGPTEYLETLFGRVGSAALAALNPEQVLLPAGTRIGDWRLIEAVGAGGMGQVYRAERADGSFEMSAAIKFIRTQDDIKLNEQLALERQLLARLDHPNIARLLDGGTLDDGQTYLVMEWVEGEDWSNCHARLAAAPNQGINHFIDVANAVNHAHQRRVVHGDIKPANIRMMDNGRVRLLDFGVARLLTDSNDPVDRETLALTPAFAAPEQLQGEPASTQSDVFSLGMLLRWLASGKISPGDSQPKASSLNVSRPEALAEIIACATASEPSQRYGSVSELINDLNALIEKRPVSVMRISPIGRLLLWAKRHQLAATAASLAIISIVAGTTGLAWQAQIVRAERDLARFEAERSSLIREQLTLLFRDAGQGLKDEDISTRELLAESVRLAEQLHADDSEILAAIRAFFGEMYIAMDDFTAAEPLLAAFVDDPSSLNSPDLLRAVVFADLAQIRLRKGESQAAVELIDESLSILADHPADNRARVSDIMAIRGQALRGLGRWEESIANAEQGLAIAKQVETPPSRLLATTENNLATTLIYAGRTSEAMPFLTAALENWRGLGQEDSSSALTIMANLASLLHQQGELEPAEALYREAIEKRKRRFGESGALGAAHLNLGTLLTQRNQLESARIHVDQGVALIERFEGEQTVNRARSLLVRSRWHQANADFDAADRDANEAHRLFIETLGPDHLFTHVAQAQQAMNYSQASDPSAREHMQAVIQNLTELQPQSNRFLAQAMCEQAKYELAEASAEQALELATRCLELRLELTAEKSWEIADARAIVAAASLVLGSEQAESDLRQARSRLLEALGQGHPRVEWCDQWINRAS